MQDLCDTVKELGCFDAVNGRLIWASILDTTLHGRTIKFRKGSSRRMDSTAMHPRGFMDGSGAALPPRCTEQWRALSVEGIQEYLASL